MRRMRTSRRRRIQVLSDIPLTPLIDTALTLLVIFMVATPIMQNAIKVTLPKGQAKEDAGLQKELIVSIDKDGLYYLNEAPLKLHDVITHIQTSAISQDNKVVYVQADREVSYGTVIELVDKLKVIGGVQHVSMATQPYTT